MDSSPSSFPSKQEGPISEVVPPPAINSIPVPVNLDERMARHEAERAAARLTLSRREGGGAE